MYYNLFLDDERLPEDVTWIDYGNIGCWHTIRTFDQFKQAIVHCMPEYISFDHDIQCFDVDNNQEYTGYDCLKWLAYYCQQYDYMMPVCFFHSKNPVGVKNMESYYKSYKAQE